ncbi:MAG: PfkB family carbohydrate kinase, partial [Chloroflexota bacterium]
RFVVIGDCLLDVTVAPSGPIAPAADVPARVTLGPGGQAANVAVRLARRGAGVRLVAPNADDAAGRLLREALAADGIEVVPLATERSGTVVVLLDGAERTMLSQRAVFPPLADALVQVAIADAAWIHCSGYVFLDPCGAAVAAVLAERNSGTVLSVGGCTVAPPDRARFLDALTLARQDLLILNRDEATSLGPGFGMVATDRDGSSATIGELEIREPAIAGPTVDATGTGDAYAAGLIALLADGPWPPREAPLREAMKAGAALAHLVAGVAGAQAPVAGEATVARDRTARSLPSAGGSRF